MATLATAYVQIVPTMKGVKSSLENMMDGAGGAAGVTGGKSFGASFGAAAKNALGVAGKAAVAGLAAAAGAAGAVAKNAIDNYTNFEQLSGGIETLFGSSANTVIRNADRAFRSAGMSANEYMETSISSAAALINSLGGDQAAAAKLMDVSITDMADNVNKMGTSMEAVQNAYRGFARGNFTMLDNLALGFAGTQEGMQQLLDKAQELTGVKYDIGSYADIVNAIHAVQTEMGITGTTAQEGAETISGSIAAMKAAWQNLLTGIANGNADVSALAGNLTSSLRTVIGNLKPVVKTALKGLTSVIRELAPELAAELPGLVSDLLPDLVAAAVGIAVALGTALAQNAPQIIQSLLTAIVSNAPALLEGGVQLVVSLASGLIQSIPLILTAGAQLLANLLQEIGKGVMQLVQAGAELVRGLWQGISGAAGWLWGKISGWLSEIWEGIKQFFGVASPSKEMAWMGEMLTEGLANGITASADDAVSAATAMSADVMGAMRADGFSSNITGTAERTLTVTGTVRVEGVNSAGELVAVSDQIYDGLIARLRQEVRYA